MTRRERRDIYNFVINVHVCVMTPMCIVQQPLFIIHVCVPFGYRKATPLNNNNNNRSPAQTAVGQEQWFETWRSGGAHTPLDRLKVPCNRFVGRLQWRRLVRSCARRERSLAAE